MNAKSAEYLKRQMNVGRELAASARTTSLVLSAVVKQCRTGRGWAILFLTGIALGASVLVGGAAAEMGDLPRGTIPNQHVTGLLDQSPIAFLGRNNPGGPYPNTANNWTDLTGYQYDGSNAALQGKKYAYVTTGGLGRTPSFAAQFQGGVAIFDVTDATNPTFVRAYVPPTSGSVLMRDVEIHDGVGYFSSQTGQAGGTVGGVFVVDLRANPTNPPLLRHLNSNVRNGSLRGLNTVHEVTLDVVSPTQTYLYAVDAKQNGAVSVYNVSNPRSPNSIGLLANIRNVSNDGINSLSTHSVTVENGLAYVSGTAGRTVNIYDVSNINSGSFQWLGVFPGGGGATHSTLPDTYVNALGQTRNVLYVTHEQNGRDFRVFDVTNVLNGTNPNGAFEIPNSRITSTFLTTNFGTGPVSNIHEIVQVGDLMLSTWPTAGLVLMDVSDPSHPQVIETFDTNATESLNYRVGAMGVDVSLGLDRVLISDRSTGLWIVDVTGQVPNAVSLSASFRGLGDAETFAAVPEPDSLVLAALALLGLGCYLRTKTSLTKRRSALPNSAAD